MSLNTGENEQGLRKVIDLTRMISIAVLLLHFYFYDYKVFQQWHFTSQIADRLLQNLAQTGLFTSFHKSKGIAFAFLLLSLLGVKGRKTEKIKLKTACIYFFSGTFIYFGSLFTLDLFNSPVKQSVAYMIITATGYLLVLTGGGLLTWIIKINLSSDVFNKLNETFPQEERLLKNEYSVNLPAVYNLKGKQRNKLDQLH